MDVWKFLTLDHKSYPIPLRHYFSRKRFALEDARIRNLVQQPLPKTIGSPPQGGSGPVLFAVADVSYFNRFANMFASSAAINSSQSAVHMHVLGEAPDVSPIKHLPRHFSLTQEAADFSRMSGAEKARYCQCMRFVRLAQFVKQTSRDYVAFDIDGLFQKSFANFSTEFSADLGLIVRPEFSDLGLRVNAGVVFMSASAAAQKFMNAASERMLKHLQHAPYIEKLDQRCLALAMNECVKPLAEELYSFEPGQGSFYSAKGDRKNEDLRAEFLRVSSGR